jgi:hypothetical protein
VIAIGQPFIYNLPTKLSAVWFPKEERVASTMMGVNMSIAGAVFGFYLPEIIVTSTPNSSLIDQPKRELKSKLSDEIK